MKGFVIFFAKIGIVVYLASQAFVDYDLVALLYQWIFKSSLQVPYGLNVGNTIAFALAAVFIIRKEVGRSKKISYLYSPESLELLNEERKQTSLGMQFGSQLEAKLNSIVDQRFPPMIPLQFSDILTAQGFEFHKDDDADGFLQYVEELSPLEVATNAVLNWMRQEAEFKQYRLELHFKSGYDAVVINSGNPDTNAYLCVAQDNEEIGRDSVPQLASETALRMFFESESQICRDFEAFTRFYRLVEKLPHQYEQYGSEAFGAIRTELLQEIDSILKLDPRFLTLQVLKGIVFFHHENKSIKAFETAKAIFEEAIENAQQYNANRGRKRWRSFIPRFLRKFEEENASGNWMISRRTMYYVQGLSELFLARIFAQNAHRFGSFDLDPARFFKERREALKRVNHGIRFLNAARRRIPVLAWLAPWGRGRTLLAYQTKGLILHCHDFYDRDEVFAKKGDWWRSKSNSLKDLKRAVGVYEKGIALCGERRLGATEEYALHSGTRIQNNCGYARLYACAIEGKLNSKPLRNLPDFERAEYEFYYSGFESVTSFNYPMANLGLLYALEGDWERSWMAGVAALDRCVHRGVREAATLLEAKSNTWIYSAEKLSSYRLLLEEAVKRSGIACPSVDAPFDENWTYIEGISELSYGFLFRSLLDQQVEESDDAGKVFLEIGLRIHRRALERFAEEEKETVVDHCDATLQRLKNMMTNLIRSFWHFDNRTNQVVDGRIELIHETLHERVGEIFHSLNSQNANAVALESSIDQWMITLEEALSIAGVRDSRPCQNSE
ncbi:MAG: hypothetical protein ACI92G_001575 [Candidatus Pelagisphaera sp.]|jgi:hypothetical protein